MVDFTVRDIQVMLAMFLALVFLNAFATAAGLADVGFNESEVPRLNLSESQFDLVGSPPERPLAEDEFRLSFNASAYPTDGRLNGSTTAQVTGPTCTFGVVTGIGQPGGESVNEVLSEEGDTATIEVDNWVVLGELEDKTTCTARGEVLESPGGGSGFFEVPFIGDVADAINGLISEVKYVGQVLFYLILTLVESILNVAATIFTIGAFVVKYLGFLFGNLQALVTAPTQTWAQLVMLSPLIVISFMFCKLGLAVISSSNWL